MWWHKRLSYKSENQLFTYLKAVMAKYKNLKVEFYYMTEKKDCYQTTKCIIIIKIVLAFLAG